MHDTMYANVFPSARCIITANSLLISPKKDYQNNYRGTMYACDCST